MKYALIGCGMIAPNHIKAALETGLEIAALCDVNEAAARNILETIPGEKRAGTAVYTDHRRMLEEVRPELAALALGSGIKRRIACDCMEAGANVIVEKPVALSLEDADAMISAAEKNGVRLCVNHQLRFPPSVRAVKAAADSGAFGRLLHATAQVRRNRNKAYFDAAPWRGTWKDDGGTLMNQCIHYTDLLQWVLHRQAYAPVYRGGGPGPCSPPVSQRRLCRRGGHCERVPEQPQRLDGFFRRAGHGGRER